MHILLIHQAFAALDEPGGTRHHELARHLTRGGHQVTVITSPVSYLTGKSSGMRMALVSRQLDDLGVTILRAYTYPALHKSFLHRVFNFFSFMAASFFIGLGVKDVDLVWGTSPPIFQGCTAWALARLKRVPFLFEVRDLWPAFAVAVGVLRNRYLILASEWLERFLYRQADCVIVNSPGFSDYIRRRGARRIELVPNGVDPAMFATRDDPGGRPAELQAKFVVMYAGAHGMSNDLGVLLEAARLLRDTPEIAVVLLGDGKEKPALQDRARELGLSNVHFFAPVPKTEMASALAWADACVAILKPIEMYKTVYPNKVFDYMAAGKPVVLAIDGVIREVVETAGAGVPVAPGDPQELAAAIRSLVADPDNAAGMGARGRAYVAAHFDRAGLANSLERIMVGLTDPGSD